MILEGDHRIADESVEEDSKVGVAESDVDVDGRQARELTAASCPTSSASKVMENFCVLGAAL